MGNYLLLSKFCNPGHEFFLLAGINCLVSLLQAPNNTVDWGLCAVWLLWGEIRGILDAVYQEKNDSQLSWQKHYFHLK